MHKKRLVPALGQNIPHPSQRGQPRCLSTPARRGDSGRSRIHAEFVRFDIELVQLLGLLRDRANRCSNGTEAVRGVLPSL